MVCAMMAGVRKDQLRRESPRLGDFLSAAEDSYPFAVDPHAQPLLHPGSLRHHRHRRVHPQDAHRHPQPGDPLRQVHLRAPPALPRGPRWYDRGRTSSLEGGDILVLSPQVLAVGISQRTEEDSIDQLAQTVLSQSKTFRKVLAFDIPKSRSFMHLDTVFTMVDRDKFTVHPNILQAITVFVMELDEDRRMKIRQEDGPAGGYPEGAPGPGAASRSSPAAPAARSTPPGSSGATVQHPGHRPRRGGGLRAERRHQPRRWRRRASGSTPSPARSSPGAAAAPVHVHAPVERGPRVRPQSPRRGRGWAAG